MVSSKEAILARQVAIADVAAAKKAAKVVVLTL